ncbi:MAG: hypothetical protein K2N33_01770 [Clostridia bacterium]|nr:hypothetical protein [Clostridia bacterium]
MKICVIDVGSNSVRLAMLADGKTLYKRISTTRLGEGLASGGVLTDAAISRTANAIADFKKTALKEGAEKVFVFATAAVRSASNKEKFLSTVKEVCGIDVDVINGEQEAECGLLGALKGGDGGIIDVGGASTEVTVQKDGKCLYSKSVNIGTVRLFDLAGRDRDKLEKVIAEKLKEYGDFSAKNFKMCAIGGTGSRLASIKHDLKEYRPEITDGTKISVAEMNALAQKLLTMPVEEIRATTICAQSADIVGGGCLLMCRVMEKFNVSEIYVSESDNLEGYYLLKAGVL